jgi:hypothetical protein
MPLGAPPRHENAPDVSRCIQMLGRLRYAASGRRLAGRSGDTGARSLQSTP